MVEFVDVRWAIRLICRTQIFYNTCIKIQNYEKWCKKENLWFEKTSSKVKVAMNSSVKVTQKFFHRKSIKDFDNFIKALKKVTETFKYNSSWEGISHRHTWMERQNQPNMKNNRSHNAIMSSLVVLLKFAYRHRWPHVSHHD